MERDFLFEIGVEEVPARFLPSTLNQMEGIALGIATEMGLEIDSIYTYATPRRLTLYIKNLKEYQKERIREIWGPPVRVAFDEKGEPTKTLTGFLKANNLKLEDIRIMRNQKGEYIVGILKEEGKHVTSILPAFMDKFILSLNFPKSMRWGEDSLRFVRPIRWLLALYGDTLIPFELDGIKTDRFSYGHRFLSYGKIEITEPRVYKDLLKKACVIVDHVERLRLIKEELQRLSSESGLEVISDDELLEHVNFIVEYPHGLLCEFSSDYLELPEELLITVMRDHQKYFALKDKSGRLSNRFIVISNTFIENDLAVRRGAERVIKARFDDARFYYEEDKKEPLPLRIDSLKKVVYQESLGTLYDKTMKLVNISEYLAKRLYPKKIELIRRSALLSKTDLVTGVVREFPELQGVMGYYYALYSGEDVEVATAIKEQYLPGKSGGDLPLTMAGTVLSIADRIDNIASFFSIGLEPTGSEDPFGLRRQAIGIISIIFERNLPITIRELVNIAREQLKDFDVPNEKVISFISQRLEVILSSRGYSREIINSLVNYFPDLYPGEIIGRLDALEEFRKTPFYQDFVLITKRVFNILGKHYSKESGIEESRIENEYEKELYLKIVESEDAINKLFSRRDYKGILEAIWGMKDVINSFFDHVLVMDKDEKKRNNRLAILSRLWSLMLMYADFSRLS